MIKLSNGYELEFLAASGALGFNGKGYWWEYPLKVFNMFDTSLFTTVTKTLTYLPEKGNCKKYNYFSCVKFLKNGVLNAMGLPNPGIYKWAQDNAKFNGIVSIYPDDNDYILRQTLRELNKLDIKGIELNISCPNIKSNDHILGFEEHYIERMLMTAKENTDIPIILKMSVNNRIENLLPNIEKYVDAFAINSIPWTFVYPYTVSPFESLGGGGLSGKIIQPYIWKFIEELTKMTNVPIIGCSVWDYDDIDRLYNIGCKAISFGSIFLRYPWRPTIFVRRYKDKTQKDLSKSKIIALEK